MQRPNPRILMHLMVFLFLIPGLAAAEGRTITVEGRGSVQLVSDMATISLGVQHQASTARAAMDVVNAKTAAVIEKLVAMGVDAGDIETASISLNPQYRHSNDNSKPPVLRGYAAGNQMSVRFSDLSRAGQILDELVDAGATNIHGLSFGVADPSAARDDARRAAVADALARARLYAEAVGGDLGEVLEISDIGESFGGGGFRDEMMRANSVPISVGKSVVSANIRLKVTLR